MQLALNYFTALNKDYLAVHQAKEALYWQNYMGLGGEDIAQQFSTAETVYKRFIAQSHRLKELRDLIAQLESEPTAAGRDELLHGLQGWYRFLIVMLLKIPTHKPYLMQLLPQNHPFTNGAKTSL